MATPTHSSIKPWIMNEQDTLEPPGRELLESENFFDVDIKDAMNILDKDQVEGVMEKWRKTAHGKLKKKQSVAVEFRPEDAKEKFIGGTLLSDDPHNHYYSEPETRSLPVASNNDTDGQKITSASFSIPRSSVISIKRSVFAQKQQDQKVYQAPPVRQTINMILVGQPYVLEWYKSLEDKRLLLQEAISTHDGNTIITIILFMRNTLSRSLFEAMLLNNTVAANHYCSFLKQNEAWEQLKAVYYVLGEESYGMLQFQQCLTQESINRRINALESCKILFGKRSSLAKDSAHIDEYIRLLKKQRTIENLRAERPMKKFQGPPLTDTTIITTLTYCCRYHLNDVQSPDENPEEFKKEFSVSDKQYFVTLLVSLCANREWDNIDRMLTPKGWQSKLKINSKIKGPISVERAVNIIGKSSFRAPEDMLVKYLRMIDDPEKRLELATRHQCYGVGVEVLKQFKDTKKLKQYLDQIPIDKQRKYRPMIAKLFS